MKTELNTGFTLAVSASAMSRQPAAEPATLVKTVGERLWKDLPGPYVDWLISKRLASTIVYREGVDFLSGMEPEAAAGTALRYLQREQDTRRLIASLRDGGLKDSDREAVARLLERSGTRGALLD